MKTPLECRVEHVTARCLAACKDASATAARVETLYRRLEDARYRESIERLREIESCTVARACWICSSRTICWHREPELIERWKAGARE